jgi:uncharacterized protein
LLVPWSVVEQEGEFCVYKEGEGGKPEGEALGCYPARPQADQRVAELYDEEGGKSAALTGQPVEYKALPQYVDSIIDRTVSGFASVMGNIDSGDDIVHPGSFRKSIAERVKRIRHLWQHRTDQPPIAVIKSIREVGREHLPADLIRDFPEATGALLVEREYLDTPRADEVLKGIKSGAINEMSFGFEIVKKDFAKVGDRMVRNLRELALWESSDVLWGMNSATRAAKSTEVADRWASYFLDQIALSKDELLSLFDFKAGRMISSRNLERLKAALSAIQEIVNAAEPPMAEEEEAPASTPSSQMALTDLHMIKVRLDDSLRLIAGWNEESENVKTPNGARPDRELHQ